MLQLVHCAVALSFNFYMCGTVFFVFFLFFFLWFLGALWNLVFIVFLRVFVCLCWSMVESDLPLWLLLSICFSLLKSIGFWCCVAFVVSKCV